MSTTTNNKHEYAVLPKATQTCHIVHYVRNTCALAHTHEQLSVHNITPRNRFPPSQLDDDVVVAKKYVTTESDFKTGSRV